MPLHLTKVAFGATSLDQLVDRFAARAESGVVTISTRYLPKRHEEILADGGGSLFWIVKHMLVARAPILGFGEADGGRVAIRVDDALRRVAARPKRAHQGWRYLEAADAPPDLARDTIEGAAMPVALAARLAALALI